MVDLESRLREAIHWLFQCDWLAQSSEIAQFIVDVEMELYQLTPKEQSHGAV